jgi:hypothetical protein
MVREPRVCAFTGVALVRKKRGKPKRHLRCKRGRGMSRLSSLVSLALVVASTSGCTFHSNGEIQTADGELRDRGYALVQVDVPAHNAFFFQASIEAAKGEQKPLLVLLASRGEPPKNVGWFRIQSAELAKRCLGTDPRSVDPDCDLGGEGALVDESPDRNSDSSQSSVVAHSMAADDDDVTMYYAIVALDPQSANRPIALLTTTETTGDDEAGKAKPKQLQ